MTAVQAKPGTIIELLYRSNGQWIASGRIFKVSRVSPITGQVEAYRRFRQGLAMLHPTTACRDLTNDPKMACERF